MNPITPSPTAPSVELMQGSCEILSQMLVQPGWTDKRKELVAGSQLSDTLATSIGERPIYTGNITAQGTPADRLHWQEFHIAVNTWERSSITFPCSDAQFQAAIACLKFFTETKRMGASIFALDLLTTFKLTE